jgi:iron complex transport system ATP-binding protein
VLPVDCEDVGVVIDGTRLVHDVSLRVEAGEWLAVIGPNGAGKTTLLHALAGLIPSEGRVHYGGRSLRSLSRRERARTVALVPQTPVIPPGMSVTDYVVLGRTAHVPAFGSPRQGDLAVTAALIDELDLARLAGRTVLSLSGGERQRCLLARTLAQEAPLLLLDEPTTGLDLPHAQQVLDLIRRTTTATGTTVISTMHDLTLAGSYAHRLALLAGGRLVATGSPAEVLREDVLERHYGGRLRVLDHEGTIVVLPGLPARVEPALER